MSDTKVYVKLILLNFLITKILLQARTGFLETSGFS